MSKTWIIVLVIVILIIIGWMFWGGSSAPATLVTDPVPTQTPATTGTGENSLTTAPATATITYTDAGFSPSVLTVKKGTTVTFQNNSSKSFWPASSKHPIHTDYPGADYSAPGSYQGSQACVAKGQPKTGAFDACDSFAPGASWAFQFNIVGTFYYHNHLSARNFGQVVVTE